MYYPYRASTVDGPIRAQVQLAAFSYTVSWYGVSDLLATYDINNNNEFSFQLPITAPNDTFILCVAWTDEDGNALRFKLWDGGVLYYPVYNGERIGADAQLEVWSADNVTAAMGSTFILYSSQLTEPELCVCTSTSQTPLIIPTYNTGSEVIIMDGCEAIQGIVALRAITGYVANQLVYLEFHTTAGDGNGGHFVFKSSVSTADDSTDYIKPNDISPSSPGRWVRQNNP